MSLLSLNNIKTKDFAELHPGGQLGRSLTMTLGELINKTEKPIVNYKDKVQTVINEISSKNPNKKEKNFLASNARKLMSKKKINHIVVVDKNDSYIGIVHILDLIKEGF